MTDTHIRPTDYASWVFDCDGVLLDTNGLKTDAFYQVARPYGDAAAQALVDYHTANGGISRFKKFDYFFRDILGRSDCDGETTLALDAFAQIVRDGYASAREADGLRDVLDRLVGAGKRCFVVSGGLQDEVRDAMAAKGLSHYFSGVFGSPDTKEEILRRELTKPGDATKTDMNRPAVFIGDSRYDHVAASAFGLDFIFASGWTEFADWKTYFQDKDIRAVVADVGALAASFDTGDGVST